MAASTAKETGRALAKPGTPSALLGNPAELWQEPGMVRLRQRQQSLPPHFLPGLHIGHDAEKGLQLAEILPRRQVLDGVPTDMPGRLPVRSQRSEEFATGIGRREHPRQTLAEVKV